MFKKSVGAIFLLKRHSAKIQFALTHCLNNLRSMAYVGKLKRNKMGTWRAKSRKNTTYRSQKKFKNLIKLIKLKKAKTQKISFLIINLTQ